MDRLSYLEISSKSLLKNVRKILIFKFHPFIP